jgi:cytochrome c oxidase subunit 4
MAAHVVPIRLYAAVFALLLALTGITTAVAFMNLGPLNNVIMLAIAVTKATLVMLYFMHLRYSTRLTRMIAAAGVLWLGFIVALTMGDYLSRGGMR